MDPCTIEWSKVPPEKRFLELKDDVWSNEELACLKHELECQKRNPYQEPDMKDHPYGKPLPEKGSLASIMPKPPPKRPPDPPHVKKYNKFMKKLRK